MKAECNHYFQTPCKHSFHEKCLKEWMKTKLECPTCRQALPAISPFDGMTEEQIDEVLIRGDELN
jgi:hypothetical protein